jgi:RNA polymerase sigma factor (sigma-70 family)
MTSRSCSSYFPSAPFLTQHCADQGTDRKLRADEFAALWAHYEPYVRQLVARRIDTCSLHRAEARASGMGEYRPLIARAASVRRSLRQDLTDRVQDVAVALLVGLKRADGLAAAAPVVEAYIRGVVRQLVPRAVQPSAVLLFASGEAATDANGSDDASPAEPIEQRTPELLAETRDHHDHLLAPLPARERAVVCARLEGHEHSAIAEELGITEGYSRLLLHRACARLQHTPPTNTPTSTTRRIGNAQRRARRAA